MIEFKESKIYFNNGGAGGSTARITIPQRWLKQLGVTEDNNNVFIKINNKQITLVKEREELNMKEDILKRIEEITKGEDFINEEQLQELEELEYVYIENNGTSSRHQNGTWYSLLLWENEDQNPNEMEELIQVVCIQERD